MSWAPPREYDWTVIAFHRAWMLIDDHVLTCTSNFIEIGRHLMNIIERPCQGIAKNRYDVCGGGHGDLAEGRRE